MRRENLRLRFGHGRMSTQEIFGDPGMNVASLASQHALVSRLLKKRVFKRVTAWDARALENDVDRSELVERVFQLVLRTTERRRDEGC